MAVNRAALLPRVLRNNPYFTDLMDATDVVFSRLDCKVDTLRTINNPYVTTPKAEQKIAEGLMLDVADWSHEDLDRKLRHLEFTGENSLPTLWYLSRYWRQKRRKAIEFTEFCSIEKWLTLLT